MEQIDPEVLREYLNRFYSCSSKWLFNKLITAMDTAVYVNDKTIISKLNSINESPEFDELIRSNPRKKIVKISRRSDGNWNRENKSDISIKSRKIMLQLHKIITEIARKYNVSPTSEFNIEQ